MIVSYVIISRYIASVLHHFSKAKSYQQQSQCTLPTLLQLPVSPTLSSTFRQTLISFLKYIRLAYSSLSVQIYTHDFPCSSDQRNTLTTRKIIFMPFNACWSTLPSSEGFIKAQCFSTYLSSAPNETQPKAYPHLKYHKIGSIDYAPLHSNLKINK